MIETDFLIIGQGIAGTLLTHFLLEAGQKVQLIDNYHKSASSNVAAGIINPVTGRRYVKSWRIDTLLPVAEQTYRILEGQLNSSFFYKRNIVRSIFSDKEEHNWLVREMEPGYKRYLKSSADASEFKDKVAPAFSYGEITESGQVDMPVLIKAYRDFLMEKEMISLEIFDYQGVEVLKQAVKYKKIIAKKIIFCEGSGAINNPFFNYLPFNFAKGEVFILHIPTANFQKSFKHKNFLVPLGNDRYWFGSSYNWEFENNLPTEKEREKLLDTLEKTLKIPFEIEQHLGAIRPTVKDRRPFLGFHPEFDNMLIFNGLGTKGASLGPYFAKHFVECLIDGKEIEETVSIKRFANPKKN